MINFEDFKKIDIRVGEILNAEKIEGSDKLLKLQVGFGEETKQIVAGIGRSYDLEYLKGKQIPFVVNLEPKTLMGIESQGMILAADNQGEPVLLVPDKEVLNGSIVK
ncbi:MAG: methionine--tRNA ligase subunit beta [Candidatus Nealsonbacteria bacterium RIFOXYB1_FULL_40_15]|uniref:Methionine--tRNA ligase n=1 Tax=Candidatus Nealsonbacteria bacterium RIFOXYB1_FULL_40_15 TaxID=1801677 RepID=A0A1G2EQS4_9BACT|nr:MAG: methionine--tRNA ligase subunit beta [Candidatus Nealsonbacteria bacterium RIFOXYB1_FULL_40_15]OGZ29512.1 MAG: methionine--tRNA ligase subunit beta [Candidatus Nealsonbacteria bacterium RIFOXYD1_FULL_39_11]